MKARTDQSLDGRVLARQSSRVSRFSWGSLATVATFAALSSTWVALTPAGDQTELATRQWAEFAQQDPEVASLYAMDLAILGLFGAGFGLLAAVVAVVPFRRGEPWAWYALWLLPITIGAVAFRMLVDQYPAGYYYAGLFAVAVVAVVLPAPRFLSDDA